MCFPHFTTLGLLAGSGTCKEVSRKDVGERSLVISLKELLGALAFGLGDEWGYYFLRENLTCVLCSWGNLPEPQRTELDLRLGSDSLGNLAGVTSLVPGLDGRPRKGAVLALHSPGLLGQGCVKFPSRSHVGHAGENRSWILPTWGPLRERRSHRQRWRGKFWVVTCRTQGPTGKSCL